MKLGNNKTFPGGVHPPDKKELSKDAKFEVFPVPDELYLPVSQHIGAPARICVEKRAEVKKGQVIAESGGFVSAPVHSPVSGTIKNIIERVSIFGTKVNTIVIKNDGKEEWEEDRNVEKSYEGMSKQKLKDRIGESGIVGLGGATFPTFVKLSPPKEKPIDTVILNGVECEPYLTCDYRLMLEKPAEILKGLQIIMKILQTKKGIIGIEANKPDAYEVMKKEIKHLNLEKTISAELLEVKYPQGAEKQLIKAILDREVPSKGLPMDVGVVVQNVGTAFAIYEACAFNKPLIERYVTITGEGVEKPANFLVRLGTPIKALLDHCKANGDSNKLILGGPMMGLAHYDETIPVMKGTSGVLLLKDAKAYVEGPCIRCGRCVKACPAYLVPSSISNAVSRTKTDLYEELNVLDCIECGCCTYVCPSKRPIIQQVKFAKAELHKQRMAKKNG